MALTCPQVEGTRSIAFNGFDVGGGQILNMNVIANAGAVRGGVIGAKDFAFAGLAKRDQGTISRLIGAPNSGVVFESDCGPRFYS